MKKLIVLGVFILFSTQFVSAQSNQKEGSKLMILKFHADWCGSCKVIAPVLKDLKGQLSDRPIVFIELDFTNNETKHQVSLLASDLAISEIVNANKGTGFLLVVDSKTKTVKGKLTKDQSAKEMSTLIESFL